MHLIYKEYNKAFHFDVTFLKKFLIFARKSAFPLAFLNFMCYDKGAILWNMKRFDGIQ